MSNFEEKYYESPDFWSEGVFEDSGNIERISKTIATIPDDIQSLLDAGCGNGIFLNKLLVEKKSLKLCGFDRSNEALKYVKTEKFSGEVTKIDLPDQSFDCVSCLEVIEHIPHDLYPKVLSELSRVAAKYLLISVPYQEDLLEDSTQCPMCKSIFNANLHLRSYNTSNFASLFDQYGFKSKKYFLAGGTSRFKYHLAYRRLFYPSQFKKWIAPICPICGFEEQASLQQKSSENVEGQKTGLFSGLKRMISLIPKTLWPKETKYYWIIGLFERTNIK